MNAPESTVRSASTVPIHRLPSYPDSDADFDSEFGFDSGLDSSSDCVTRTVSGPDTDLRLLLSGLSVPSFINFRLDIGI